MGTITRSFANNLTTGGVLKAGAFNDASLNNVTALNAAIATGGMVLLSSQTASSSASISFTTGIDSTYKEYLFYFINIHASSNSILEFQVSTDGGSNYGVAITSTAFDTAHAENDTFTVFEYQVDSDLAQSTSYQNLIRQIGTDNDNCAVGTLQLFNPSSSVYVKHFLSRFNTAVSYNIEQNIAGYINSTSPINAIRFKMASGNIDDGTILMYGIK
jgi:hypothetical protein